jgi:hypothetical protein
VSVRHFKIPASTTLAKGTVVGEMADTLGTVDAYATGGSNGLNTALGIMVYDVISDASGNITFGTTATGDEFGVEHLSCPVYVKGTFRTNDLTGLDAAGVADMNGHLTGTVSDGILRF